MQLSPDTQIKDDLVGVISIKFKPESTFNNYCAEHIENYNPDRFEVLAVKAHYGKETNVTVFAIDRDRMENSTIRPVKIPVKKFKLNADFIRELIPHFQEYNFTLNTGNYPLEDMEVINK